MAAAWMTTSGAIAVEGRANVRGLFQIKRVPDKAGPLCQRLFAGEGVDFPIGGRLLDDAPRDESAAAGDGQFAHRYSFADGPRRKHSLADAQSRFPRGRSG